MVVTDYSSLKIGSILIITGRLMETNRTFYIGVVSFVSSCITSTGKKQNIYLSQVKKIANGKVIDTYPCTALSTSCKEELFVLHLVTSPDLLLEKFK